MKSKAYHSYLIKAFFLSDVSCDQKPFVTKSTYFVFKTKVLPVIESQLGTHLFLRKKAFICCWLSSLFGVTLHRQRTRWVKTFGTTWTDLSSQERDQHHFCFPCQINRKLILKNRDECDWLRWLILTFFQFDDRLPICVMVGFPFTNFTFTHLWLRHSCITLSLLFAVWHSSYLVVLSNVFICNSCT